MARDTHDREDLLAEATGLPVRGVIQMPDGNEVVVGFRDDGSPSWFFAADPVFQFDPNFQLRRIFCDGTRYAVAGGQILRLEQTASGGRLQLTKHPLNSEQTQQMLQRWEDRIRPLQAAMQNKTHRWQGTSVPIAEIEPRVLQWLADCPAPPTIAKVSRLPRRRSS
ncbi:hypothetical protein [Rosistilla oblonga]|uniref:hypothetical protein n=1 Tax=Rosistilla oblonga TaxID=2527990 RepID=UPI003A982AC4